MFELNCSYKSRGSPNCYVCPVVLLLQQCVPHKTDPLTSAAAHCQSGCYLIFRGCEVLFEKKKKKKN